MTRTRIAPSPTGFPHVGTIFQALFDYILARQGAGQFLVRIEDTDQSRKVEGAEEAIFDALEWVHLSPDESVKNEGDVGPYRQSERLDIYKKYADQLIEQGNAYYCFCSSERLSEVRAQMQKDGKPPMYDKHCRNLDPAEASQRAQIENHVVRMKIPENETITFTDEIRGEISFESATVDDQVIVKSDGFPTYHLAVVVDDHLMKITHMIRGEEWISSTPKHVLLYRYFNWQMPKIIHTPLLRNPDKSKLSKRHGHASVAWYQDNGYLPEALINFLATRVWNHPEGLEVFSLEDLIKHFKVQDMNIQGPIADLDKLNWYNGLYIRQLSDEDLFEKVQPYVTEQLLESQVRGIIPLVKERMVTLTDINELSDFLYNYHEPQADKLLKKADVESVTIQLSQTISKLNGLDSWSVELIEKVIRDLQAENDWNRGQYFMMLRWAVTGKKATPPLFETIEVIGKEEVIERLEMVQKLILK